MPRYLVCLTGASGAIYALRLLSALVRTKAEIHLVSTAWGQRVVHEETGRPLGEHLAALEEAARDERTTSAATRDAPTANAPSRRPRIELHSPEDLAAPLSSGSFRLDGTVVIPCSMGTIGALASGLSANLVQRAGAVALKEGWPLVLVPRETPLSLIALRALVTLKEAGATILPASPGFYARPSTIEDLADQIAFRALDILGSPVPGASRWSGGGEE